MKVTDYIKGIPKTVAKGACLLGFAGMTALSPVSGLEQNLDNSTPPESNTPPKSIQIGGVLSFHYPVALRFVYGWDKRVGFQADIGLAMLSANVRLRHDGLSNERRNVYGFIGGLTLAPWMYALGEPSSPTAGIDFGVGVERRMVLSQKLRERISKKDLRSEGYLGIGGGLVLFPFDDQTIGIWLDVNAGLRFK